VCDPVWHVSSRSGEARCDLLYSVYSCVLCVQTKESGKMIEKPVMKADSGTQTDTHFHESNIVASYEWNEWELRRKALKLVSIPPPPHRFVHIRIENLYKKLCYGRGTARRACQ